jgi:hypothetical protein
MTYRIGIFFLFIGLIDSPAFLLFFAALGMIFLGIALMRKGYTQPPPSERFKSWRKFRNKNDDSQE